MRNKTLACILAWTLAFAVPVYAKDITVNMDGAVKDMTISPVIVNDYTMVGMREIFNLLGATVWWDSAAETAHARGANLEMEIKIGSPEMKINGRAKQLTAPAQIINGNTMVPLGVISEAFGYGVAWDGENSEVILTSPSETGAGALLTADTPLLDMDALGKSETVLEYDDAVTKVVAKNSDIKNLNDTMDRMQEQRDEIWTYQLYNAAGTATSTFITGLRTLSQMEYVEQNAPLNKEMIATGAEYAMRATVSGISQMQMEIVRLKESISLSQFNLTNNLELRLELGLSSESEVREERRALEQSKSQLASLELSLASMEESLALMLGYDAGADVSVNYRPEFVEGGIDIEQKVKAIDKVPTIVIYDRAVKQAEYEYDTWSRTWDRELANAPQESKLELENAVLSAQRTLADAKTGMEKNLRSTYNEIKSYEETQKSLELALEKARDNYNTALVNYEAGNITKYNVDLARMGILSAEIDIQKNIYKLDDLRFAIDRPYLLTALDK